ncbi:MAG: CDP-alcohol phosphatidyltransferase family protein [Pseudomonadota bacterium]
MEPETEQARRAAIVGTCDLEMFGVTPAERLRRQFDRSGLNEVQVDEAEVLISGAHVFDTSVITALASARPGTALIDGDGQIAGLRTGGDNRDALIGTSLPAGRTGLSGAELAGDYNKQLRKRTNPMVMPATDRRAVEQALFAASYKGVTDIVTKHFWPVPALAVTRFCARWGITPNQVTWASAVLVGVTFWLFWIGAFLPGLVAAYAMTFLDTVDGKLARVTLTSSKLGDVLDHGIDLIHPPFWWWAWAVGCAAVGDPLADGGLALGIIIAGYVLQRMEEGLFLWRFGMEMHVWQRFDSLFRQITARRNPNLLILTVAAVLGAPREGLIAVAAWVALCLLIHLVRIGQAYVAQRQAPLSSWLDAA